MIDTTRSIKHTLGKVTMKKILLMMLLTPLFASASPININTADAPSIAGALKNIGLKKAQAIVDYRSKNGPFKNIDDVDKVPGIGTKTLEKLKADLLLTDTPEASPATESSKAAKK